MKRMSKSTIIEIRGSSAYSTYKISYLMQAPKASHYRVAFSAESFLVFLTELEGMHIYFFKSFNADTVFSVTIYIYI